ncbi:41044_t:CDS:2, partial [Gigaspora margarita]
EVDKDKDKKKNRISKKNNKAFKIIEKAAKMDYINKIFESSLENDIKSDNKISKRNNDVKITDQTGYDRIERSKDNNPKLVFNRKDLHYT